MIVGFQAEGAAVIAQVDSLLNGVIVSHIPGGHSFDPLKNSMLQGVTR